MVSRIANELVVGQEVSISQLHERVDKLMVSCIGETARKISNTLPEHLDTPDTRDRIEERLKPLLVGRNP